MFQQLRTIRKSQGYTCEKMAEKLGITKATYSKKERGKMTISLVEARKISNIFGKSIEDIFFDN